MLNLYELNILGDIKMKKIVIERHRIEKALSSTKTKEEVAKELGISVTTLRSIAN